MNEPPDQIEAAIAATVAAHAGISVEQVEPSTRLYHDLMLSGDDFAELIGELHQTYGLTLRGKLSTYCPTESAFWTWWPFFPAKEYREVTVAELTKGARLKIIVG
jgi:acyl carrier protein